MTGDTPTCDHGITLADRVTGKERCAECGAIVTGDTPSPLDVLWDAHCISREHHQAADLHCEECAALAQVEALAEAAHRMEDWDFAALPHLEDGWRAIAQDDVDALTVEVAALRAALVPFAAHKDTNHA